MKYLLLLCLSLLFYTGIAQNKGAATKVTYESEKDEGYFTTLRVSELLFNPGKSQYTKGEGHMNNLPENATVKNEGGGESFNEIFYVDLASEKLYTKSLADGKVVLAEEKLSDIPWKIEENKTDTIMGLACTKAVGAFRGREFTVWFTPEIPVPFGPWKLQGLPGLIIEAKDDRDQIEFAATKIETLNQDNPKAAITIPLEEYPILSLKEFVLQERKDIKRKVKRVISKLPKGTKVSNLKRYKHPGIELKYKWEED